MDIIGTMFKRMKSVPYSRAGVKRLTPDGKPYRSIENIKQIRYNFYMEEKEK